MSIIYYPGYSQVIITPKYVTRVIDSISKAAQMVVTTSVDHGYVANMNITFLIPSQFGMVELNGKNGNILSVTSDTFTVDINSLGFTTFAYPSPLPTSYTPPSVIPNAEGRQLPNPYPQPVQAAFDGTSYNEGQP